MVTVKMKPIKRTIRISAEDAESAKAVKDVKLEIVAAEDIKAADGTVRYPSGKVVEKLTTNDKGSAESKELYIGKYSVKQASAPKYYAVDPKAVAASVTEDSGTDKGLIKIDCVKTKVTVTLTDERTEKPIKGAVYELEGKDELTTDSNGQITITDLNKSTGYKLNVKSVPKGYHKKSKELSFKVDGKGLVKDEVSHELNDTAYTISLDVRVRDYFFGRKATKLMWESGFKTIGCAVTSVKTFRDILLEAQKISLFFKNPLKRAEKEAKKANKKAGKKDKKAKKSKRKSKKDRTSEAE